MSYEFVDRMMEQTKTGALRSRPERGVVSLTEEPGPDMLVLLACEAELSARRGRADGRVGASTPVERWHRDAKIHTILEGTSEIQRLITARAISGAKIV